MKIYVYSTGDSKREASHMQALDKMERAIVKKESPGWWSGLVPLEYVSGFTPGVEDNTEAALKLFCLLPRTNWAPQEILELVKTAQGDKPSQLLYYSPPETMGFRLQSREQREFVTGLMEQHLLLTDMKKLARDLLNIPAHIWSDIKVGRLLSFGRRTIELKVGA